MGEDQQTADSLKLVSMFCGVVAGLLGIQGFAGWFFGSRLLGGMSPAYIPMAPSTALGFIFLGTILAIHGYKSGSGRGGFLTVALISLVTLFGMFTVTEYLIGIDLSYEGSFFPVREKFGKLPLYKISPITGFIFFVAGSALLLLVRFKARRTIRQLAGSLGSLVCIAGFVATVGYLFGTPLLYGGSIIPLAATTAIAFMLLGSGLMAAAGPDAFPVRFLAGPSVQARLLRFLIPLAILAFIVHGLAQSFITGWAHLNQGLLTALVALVFVAFTGVVVTWTSRLIAQAMERALTERIQAEKDLHRSQQMLQLVLDSIPVGVFWKDRELRYLGCNRTTAQATGFSDPHAIIGKTDFDLPWKNTAESYRAVDRQVIETGTPRIKFEEMITLADGSLRWVETSKVPLRNQDGMVFGVLGVYEDITARKQAEKKLKLKEKILDGACDSIFLHDLEGRFLYVNEAACKDRGYEKEELLAKDLSGLIAPEFFRIRELLLRDLFTRGEIVFDSEHLRQDGSVMPVEIHARTIDMDDEKLILSVARDITERKRAAEEFLREKQVSDTIIDSLPGVFYFFNDQGRFLRWNANFEQVSGYSAAEFARLTPLDLFAGEDKNLINQAIQEVFLSGANTAEAELVAKDGGKIPYFFTGRRIDLDGTPCLLGMGMDISARQQAEEELRAAARKWKTTFNAISDGVALLDTDCHILQCNQAMADLLGRPLPEILSHHCWELMHSTVGPIDGCPLVRMNESGHRETLTIRMGERWLHVMVDPILNQEGGVIGGVHIIADITGRKIAQDQIHDLNTLLKAIKDVNEALLRVKSEPELFQQTCDLLTQVPYVRFVWIGLKEWETFVVKPAAWAGQEEGYLSAIRVTWDDSPQGQGPIGTAIKTGRPVVVSDTATDPMFDFWREEALRRGYLSTIALPLEHEGITQGSLNVYAGKPQAFGQEELEFLSQVAGDIAVGIKSLRLAQRLELSLQQMQVISQQTVEALAATVEIRDPYTSGHQQGVTRLALALAAEMGLAEDRLEGLRKAGCLHDIGKIMVPAEILSKPGRLNDYEMQIIKSHSQAGYDILAKIDFPWPVAQIVLQHHERLDGSGYPRGLQGPDILQEAKILAVADVVEAMASHRPYRPALGLEKALEEINRNKGILYDPAAVEACCRLFNEQAFDLQGALFRESSAFSADQPGPHG